MSDTQTTAADAYLKMCGIRWQPDDSAYLEGHTIVSGLCSTDRAEKALGAVMHSLGWCGCGSPETALGWLRDVLAHVDGLQDRSRGWDDVYGEFKGREAAMGEGAAWFAYYTLDTLGLTEHGGSVPGWLSDRGVSLLAALRELLPPEEAP